MGLLEKGNELSNNVIEDRKWLLFVLVLISLLSFGS